MCKTAIAKTWKQPKCPLTNEWMKKMWYIYTMEYLFNLYAEYIMRNAWLDEAQAGIKIAGRNSNNLRYANETSLMAESEEELRGLLLLSRFSRVRLCAAP